MKKKLLIVLFFLISVSFSVVLIEYSIGKFVLPKVLANANKDWRSGNYDIKNCFRISADLGYEPVWGKCGMPYLINLIAENSNNNNILGIKTERVYKILLLGDSNTFRSDVDRYLEDGLNKKYNSININIKVIKVGVESYNTAQEIKLLKTRLLDLNPDLIILQYTPNDFEFTPVVMSIGNSIVYFSSQYEYEYEINSYLYNLSNIYKLIKLMKVLVNSEDANGYKITPQMIKSMENSIGIFKSITSERGIDTLVVMYPVFDSIQWDDKRNVMKKILKNNNIETIDLLDYKYTYGNPDRFHNLLGDGEKDIIHPIRGFDLVVSNIIMNYIVGQHNIIKF